MSFTIFIIHDRKTYRYQVECIRVTGREETYGLTARNKSILFINNRPFLQSKKLKHWKPTWKIEGEIWNVYYKNILIKAIEEKIGIVEKK